MIATLNRNSDEDFDRLGLAIYAEAILKLLRMKSRDLDKGPKALAHLLPFKVAEKLIGTFTEQR